MYSLIHEHVHRERENPSHLTRLVDSRYCYAMFLLFFFSWLLCTHNMSKKKRLSCNIKVISVDFVHSEISLLKFKQNNRT